MPKDQQDNQPLDAELAELPEGSEGAEGITLKLKKKRYLLFILLGVGGFLLLGATALLLYYSFFYSPPASPPAQVKPLPQYDPEKLLPPVQIAGDSFTPQQSLTDAGLPPSRDLGKVAEDTHPVVDMAAVPVPATFSKVISFKSSPYVPDSNSEQGFGSSIPALPQSGGQGAFEKISHVGDKIFIYAEEKNGFLDGELILNSTDRFSAGLLLYEPEGNGVPLCKGMATFAQPDTPTGVAENSPAWWGKAASGQMQCQGGDSFSLYWKPLSRETGFIVAVKLGLQSRHVKNSMFMVYGMARDAALPLMQNLATEKDSQRKKGTDAMNVSFTATEPGAGTPVLSGIEDKFQNTERYSTALAYAYSGINNSRYSGSVQKNVETEFLSVMLESKAGNQCYGVLEAVGLEQQRHRGSLICTGGVILPVNCQDEPVSDSHRHSRGFCLGKRSPSPDAPDEFAMRYGTTEAEAFSWIFGN